MTWHLSNEKTALGLEKEFAARGIPTDQPGFYDHPNFLKAERRNPRYLEKYAQFVEARAYSNEYLVSAKRKIETVAQIVGKAVRDDGRLGACVDVSMMVNRMLDRIGVWNYAAKATLTTNYPASSGVTPRYFWVLDEGRFAAAHAFIVAPPFAIVDLTIKYQPHGDAEKKLLPSMILAEGFEDAVWTADDLAHPSLRDQLARHGIPFNQFMRQRFSHMLEVMTMLPPRLVHIDGVSFKYIVNAVLGSIEPLEGITGYKPGGRTALEIFDTQVLPALEAPLASQRLNAG